ncbi:DUF3305 domain-containing protein [Microbaculum marinisediminis]|uniref:DUF3305 domain-containing protein n=1 Tax=Microbaculum marinisediminis TaxID=2931392 RepID=A0AAW5QX84_9HYPH|nr:DUF3305 domain-containing protein [Microbaculum sp. A6E488]MCT8971086.1 DUF3305 domain-containing protein [Microbaculum sp. A6E488]
MEKTATIQVGIVVERRESDSRWIDATWKPVSILVGAPPVEGWRELASGERWRRYHAATVPLELHRTDAESYKYNLSTRSPSVFVVMTPTGGERPWRVLLATASAYEGESYLTSDEVMVEAVPMPPEVAAWVRDFAEAHFDPEPFRKRKRDRPPALEEAKFGKEPIFTRRPAATPPRKDRGKETDG